MLGSFRSFHENEGIIRLKAGGLGLFDVHDYVGRGNLKFVGFEEIYDFVDADRVVNSGQMDGSGRVPLFDGPDSGFGLAGAFKSAVVGFAHGIEGDPALVDEAFVHLRTCFSAELFGLKQDCAEYGGSIFGLLPLDEDRVR
jgi:hypothetical protein